MFDWCMRGRHNECRRSFERWEIRKVKRKEVFTYTGEIVKCQCTKKGCKCNE